MKRFALTICLAACLVFLSSAAVFAVNEMTIESLTIGAGGTANIGVFVTNDLTLKYIIAPLVVRPISGGSYITSLKLNVNSGRMNGKLADVMIYNGYQAPNGVCPTTQPSSALGTINEPALDANTMPVPTSPAGLMIVRGIILGATLPAGTDGTTPSFTIVAGLNASCPGSFEIDTTCADPANHFVFVRATGTPGIVASFNKGLINVICNPCPTNTTNLATVSATIGVAASKALSSTDDEPNTFAKISGPGVVTTGTPGPPAGAGTWSYTPTCADYPGFDVVFEVYNSNGAGNCGTATFHVDVAGVAPVVSNCGNVSVHWGALASKTIGVTGGCAPYTFSGGAPGSVDANGVWTDETNCQQIGDHAISVTVQDATGQIANCNFTLSVTNDPAVCSNPADVTAPTGVPLSITMGPAVQADGDALTYAASGTWPAWLSISGNQIVGARPAGDNTPYSVCFTASDGCVTSAPCCVNVLFESPYQICIVDPDSAAIGHIVNYVPSLYGVNKTVGIWVNPATGPSGGTGGFEFLICYDQSLLRFMTVTRGPNLDPSFEYFTYRTGAFGGNCGGGCPNGYVKIVGIADINNGITPAPGAFVLGGVIALITFNVDGNLNNIGLCPHVGFCSFDCTDNSLSSKDGYTLYVPSASDPDITLGPDYTCVGNNKPGHNVNEFIDFCAGAICIQRPPDDRGDLNLNGVANEIGDAVLYSRYFISGINVFESNANLRAVQILASDINNDGMPLTVADLVYLIRIITGDAQPFPPQGSGFKLSPYANSVAVNSDVTNGSLNIRTNANVDLGGALFVYHYSGVTVGQPSLVSGTNLQVKSTSANGELRILVYGTAAGAKVPAGLNNLITVPVSGNGTVELAESQVSDASGALLSVNASSRVPTSYALLQNYPNPFNAGTVIQFSLKDQSDWNLSIYNIAGQVVRTFSGNGQGPVSVSWDGSSENGASVASGMYFYRLTAKDFTATKKMVLMK